MEFEDKYSKIANCLLKEWREHENRPRWKQFVLEKDIGIEYKAETLWGLHEI